jgi:hypothetical protein
MRHLLQKNYIDLASVLDEIPSFPRLTRVISADQSPTEVYYTNHFKLEGMDGYMAWVLTNRLCDYLVAREAMVAHRLLIKDFTKDPDYTPQKRLYIGVILNGGADTLAVDILDEAKGIQLLGANLSGAPIIIVNAAATIANMAWFGINMAIQLLGTRLPIITVESPKNIHQELEEAIDKHHQEVKKWDQEYAAKDAIKQHQK